MLTINRLKDVINKENTSITEKISNVFLMIADSDVSFCNGDLTCFNKDNYDNYRYSNWLIKINKSINNTGRLEEFVLANIQHQEVLDIIISSYNDIGSKIIKRIMAQKYLYNYSINRILEDCDISLYSYYQFIKIGENIFLKNIEKELCYNTNYEKT